MFVLYKTNFSTVDNKLVIGEVIMSKPKRWKDIKKIVKRNYLKVKEVKPDNSYSSTKNVKKEYIIGKANSIAQLKIDYAEYLF